MVRCKLCDQEWERDPALEVPCPTCGAGVGVRCKRPSGHACEVHFTRDRAAMEAGLLQPCPAAKALQRQLALF